MHARHLLDGVYKWGGHEQGGNDQDDWCVDERRDADWRKFWKLARDIEQSAAVRIILAHQEWHERLRVRTLAENWQPLARTLLPGPIVKVYRADPALRKRISAEIDFENLLKWFSFHHDGPTIIDTDFHQADQALLQELGAVAEPHPMPSKGRRWTCIPLSSMNAEMPTSHACR